MFAATLSGSIVVWLRVSGAEFDISASRAQSLTSTQIISHELFLEISLNHLKIEIDLL